jgi:hypothetical protein
MLAALRRLADPSRSGERDVPMRVRPLRLLMM